MGKSSTQNVLREILLVLSQGETTLTEISEKTGVDRTAIARYLDLFQDVGLVRERKEGRHKRYRMEGCTYNPETYFGLPLEKATAQLIDSIYARIQELWQGRSKRPLSRLQAQKMLFKVNKLCSLNIPVGWYLYGGISVKPYDQEIDYVNEGLPEYVEECIVTVVEEFLKDDFAYTSKLRQYDEEREELYLVKEQILRILHSPRFGKDSLPMLKKKLEELIDKAPSPRDDTYTSLLANYKGMISEIATLEEQTIIDLAPTLRNSFDYVWKLIAMYRFKSDLLSHYSQETLDAHMGADIAQQEKEAIEVCSEIQSMVPVQEPDDSTYEKIQQMLQNISYSDKEERERKEKELQGFESTEEKNTYLLKRFGLE